jgi:hypothetical protein
MRRRADLTPDKIFEAFPAAFEFLYVFDDCPTQYYRDWLHYISEHMASALIRMVPELRAMTFNSAFGVRLQRVKKTIPHVIFDCIGFTPSKDNLFFFFLITKTLRAMGFINYGPEQNEPEITENKQQSCTVGCRRRIHGFISPDRH